MANIVRRYSLAIWIVTLATLASGQTISPSSFNFGAHVISTTSSAHAFTLTNSLAISISISSITTSGDFAQTNTCGTSLAASAHCTINVTFTPTTTGTRTGTLTVTDSAANSPQTASLSGSGEVAAKVSTASAFGNQVVSTTSSAQALTLTNNQTISLHISAISTSGDFAQTNNCGSSIGAGATCTINVTFTPTTTGTRTGTLSVTDDAANSPQTTSLTGTGVSPTTMMPTSWSFGSVAFTGSVSKVFQFTNNQTTTLTISSITTSGDFFQTNTCGTSLAAGASCNITVTFSPTALGSRTGTLTVTDNASDSPKAGGLTGTGAAAPTITSLSPTFGIVGTSVTITGTHFAGTQGNGTITFNGTLAPPTSWSMTSIVVPVPAGATTGNVVVNADVVNSNGVSFTVVPNITSLSVTSGAVGASVTISGTSFGSSQGTSTVTFNGTSATASSWGSSSITVTVPSGATTGSVVVTVGGSASNGVTFPVVPHITSLSVTSGAVGASVTIAGTSFGSSQGTSTVTFNGTSATASSWGSNSITVSVPTGATTGNVVVTVGGVASNGIGFTVQSGSFAATSGSMANPRYGQTATRLTTGQVLITGGMSTSSVVNSAELYAPATQTFTATGTMNVARWQHTATLLNNGQVLIVGGSDLANQETLDSAELYDPTAGTFTLLSGTLNTPRVGHTATLLSTGEVLIVGGYDPATGIIADAELYDPDAQVFNDLGDTNAPRFGHSSTLLQNGHVLITGGETDPTPSGAYNTAEIFDPLTQDFTPLPAVMTSAREGHTATLLNNGQVLLTGGDVPGTGSLNTAEIYDPVANLFTAVSGTMIAPRISHTAVLLNGGKVLIVGGATDSTGSSVDLNTAEIYDPSNQTFSAAGNMTSIRDHETTTILNDGTVLVDGGTDGTNTFNTAELYMASQLSGLTSITIAPATPSIPLGAEQFFTATGHFSGGATQSLASVIWSSSDTATITINNDASDTGFTSNTAQGSATITASAGGISGSTTPTITAPALVSITLSPQDLSIGLDVTQQFTATGTYTDSSTQDLTSTATWSSLNSAVATVSSAGIVDGISQGYTTIQAGSGSVNATTNISVSQAVLASIALTPSTSTIALGKTQQYQAVGTYSDGSTQDITTLVTWASGSPSVAGITPTGLATGSTQGTTSITATFESISASASLGVGTQVLVSLAVTPGAASIAVGSTQQLTATGTYTDGSTQNLTSSSTWVSSNTGVATVSNSGLGTAVTSGNTTITATVGGMNGTAVLVVVSSTDTGSGLNTSRYSQSATTLNNGKILIAGGVSCPTTSSCSYLNSAEIYDPVAGTSTNTGSLAATRSAPAVLLASGKVLIAGGYSCDSSGNCASLSSAEIYDPTAGTFSSAGTMTVARSGQTATLLNNGKVLIAGGETCTSTTSCTALHTAEIYDPVAGTFTATSNNMSAARFNASAVALNQGLVLIAGGFDGSNFPAATELFDPVAGTFSGAGASLNLPRFGPTATLLNTGKVLIAGGSTCNLPGCPASAAELYDPIANTFSYATGMMNVSRFNHSATLLTNGQVFIAGGYSSCATTCTSEASTELFDPVAGTFTSSTTLANARAAQSATLLSNGSVLLIGGINSGLTFASAESYQPSNLTPSGLVSISISPSSLSMTPGQTQQFMATGTFSDSSTQILQSAIWNSSSPSVVSVSNSAGNAGTVNALTSGTSTLSATTGDIGGSATLRVASLVSLAIVPSSPTLTVGTSQQFTATGTFSDSSTQDLTTSVTWTSSSSPVILIANTSGFQGVAAAAGAGTASVTATSGSVNASTSVTVQATSVASAPVITGLSTPVGVGGTQVTISGSGFGSTQGSGSVWLGSTFGVVVSWSSTQIVATVASNSQSGTAQITQGGVLSNAVTFTVNTATITAVSPPSGVAGTQVTISGSGFGAVQGAGQVWLGTASGLVESWSDSQVVAQVAAGSTTGTAQVLQNGVWSNPEAFTVNTPHITNITPTSGNAGTAVTITGTGFGASQGTGTVWIGSTDGQVVSWTSTQVVATVASSALTGIVRIEQNGIWSNAVAFTVTGLGSNTVTLNPHLLNMVIGGTQTIQALNASSQSVTGLTWTSSNTNIVSLSTDDPPILTAVAAGHVTISAGTASADVTVYSGALPTGTVIWSNPGDGSGVINIVPAVPNPSGIADVFAFQADGTVQAVKSDGTTAWTADVSTAISTVPDFQGGLIVSNFQSITRLDGITGQSYPAYTAPTTDSLSSSIAVHTDSTVFAVDNSNFGFACCTPSGDEYPTGTVSVVGINPTTGTQTFSIPLDQSTSSSTTTSTFLGGVCPSITRPTSPISRNPDSIARPMNTSNSTTNSPPTILGTPIIAGDGYFYIAYQYQNVTSVTQSSEQCAFPNVYNSDTQTTSSSVHFMLMRVGTDGSSSKIDVKDWNPTSVTQTSNFPGALVNSYVNTGAVPNLQQVQTITNADQGSVLGWEADVPAYCASGTVSPNSCNQQITAASTFGFATTVGDNLASSSTTTLSGQAGPIQPLVQAQDGTFFGTVGVGPSPGTVTQYNMVALDKSGNVLWSVPNEYPQIATADGGVIGGSGITYDNNGRATGQTTSSPIQSWRGDTYRYGSVDQVAASPTLMATTLWAQANANPSGSSTAARPWYFVLIWQNDFTFTPDNPTFFPNLTTDISYRAVAIKQAALKALKDEYSAWPVTVVEGTPGTGDARATVLNHQTLLGTASFGATDPNNITVHQVDYILNMEDAQEAYGTVINNAHDENGVLQKRTDMIQAIGKAVGNTAGHEIAHQFLLECCDMDANPQTDPNARGTYNAAGSNALDDPSFWTGYWPNPIIYLHWQNQGGSPTAQDALSQCLGKGWRNLGVSPCHN
jgi:Bacterial Ig-like domain (group 2)/Protein of unknown function (DUF1573)/IPT/TIG domain/Abnormal spindle-like microcephaly-assoc'd, ASPM-SPD-2-Hydin/Galactose oxidase, central domain